MAGGLLPRTIGPHIHTGQYFSGCLGGEVVDSLDENLVMVNPQTTALWKWVGNSWPWAPVRSIPLLMFAAPHTLRARAWIRCHDPRSHSVHLPASLYGSVNMWREAIRLTPHGDGHAP